MNEYTESCSPDKISLHDSCADRISLCGRELTFYFSHGFSLRGDDGNYTDTGSSELCFTLSYDPENAVTVYIFTEKDNMTIRENIPLSDFTDMINGGCRLEFLYSSKGDETNIYRCWLWSDKNPYHKECMLIISADNMIYRWE